MPTIRKTAPEWAYILDLTAPYDHTGPFVYFVQAESGGPVKIGTTHDVISRVAGMQTGSSDRLIVRCVVLGDQQIERGLHYMFREHRVRGEWFSNADEILAFAEEARQQCVGMSADERLKVARERRLVFQQRLAALYRRGTGISVIAEQLGCSEAFVYKQLARMREIGIPGLELRQVKYCRPGSASDYSAHTPDFADALVERLSA